jgi:diadenosine tetraphosphate (Ap4A) HIT family hydrolase
MARWDDSEAWASLCNGSGCPICLRGRPLDVLVERAFTWVTSGASVPVPGYTCVVAKRHVVEPYELEPVERHSFFDDVVDIAARIAALYRPVKMNYEIHGNTIPHLHAHLYPRSPNDGYGARSFEHRPEDLEAIRRALG